MVTAIPLSGACNFNSNIWIRGTSLNSEQEGKEESGCDAIKSLNQATLGFPTSRLTL